VIRKLAAEAIGSAFLVATVVGAGVMGVRLSGGNVALALLGDTLATGAILTVLIAAFGPVSGAHFNPAVSLVMLVRREMSAAGFAAYVAAQIAGAIAGTFIAHAMFDLPVLQVATTIRSGPGMWLSEVVATFGLVITILALRSKPILPAAVGLYIAAAYWFTASTSFANPAVAIARSLSDTFAGIAPASLPAFIAAEVVGALLAAALGGALFSEAPESPPA
jgi:glycerol uptake facilitator-like aquaporin